MVESTSQQSVSFRGPATLYNFYCNQAVKGGPFGSSITSTGSNTLHQNSADNLFTGAILRDGNSTFKPGDIVIARNNTTGKQVLLVLDDTGQGNGHGSLIDIPEGPAADALGVTNIKHDGKGGVAGAEGADDITFTKVAHVDTDDKVQLKQVILKVADINTKRDATGNNTGQLSELNGMVAFTTDQEGKPVDTTQVVSTAKVNVTPTYAQTTSDQTTHTRDRLSRGFTWDRNKTEEENKDEQRKHMQAELAAMPPEEKMLFTFLALLCKVLTGEDLQTSFDSLAEDKTLAPRERELSRSGATAARTGHTEAFQKEFQTTELGGAKLPPLPTDVKYDPKNYSVPVRNPVSGEVRQLQIVKDGHLVPLNNKDMAAYMLYVSDKAANTRAGMPDAKVGQTFDIAHFTTDYTGADQLSGVNETLVSTFLADRGIEYSKEAGIKPHVVQEDPRIRRMLQQTEITGELPLYSQYGMKMRAQIIDANARLYGENGHVGISQHFDGPETGNTRQTEAEGSFGLINGNRQSAVAGTAIMQELSTRGAFGVKSKDYLRASSRGFQKDASSTVVLIEAGNGYNPTESNNLVSAEALDRQERAVVGGVIKYHISGGRALYNAPTVNQAGAELKVQPQLVEGQTPVTPPTPKVTLNTVPGVGAVLTANNLDVVRQQYSSENVAASNQPQVVKSPGAETNIEAVRAKSLAEQLLVDRGNNQPVKKDGYPPKQVLDAALAQADKSMAV